MVLAVDRDAPHRKGGDVRVQDGWAGGQWETNAYPYSSSNGEGRADSCESIDRY